jgi:alpha-glucosidase (family GH31 glycosyl hydrolase)
MITKRLFRVQFPLRYELADESGDRVRIQTNHPCYSTRATSTRRRNMWVHILAMCCFLWGTAEARAQLWDVPPLPPVKYAPAPDGMTATIGNESLHVSVCRSSVIHFVATLESPDTLRRTEPWMLDSKDSCPGAKFQLSQTADAAILTTDALKVEFSLKWGNVQYSTAADEKLLRERNAVPRTYEPVELNGEKTFHVDDRFGPEFGEGFYGLGQHQNGMFNYRGGTVELGQNNTDVAIPLLVSSMDWRSDTKTRDNGDQFMFGPSVLVSPVLQADATRRTLYLPDSPAWYDFWTGTSQQGGREIDAEAPLERIPLYVRAGSILPLGPEIEYADEKPAGPIELRIYAGADGKFDLYQDAGDSYEYENGAHSIIPLQWSQSTRTLTVGDRQGRYPEMPVSMQIKIVWVSGGHGAGLAPVANPDKTVEYAEGNFRTGAMNK